MSILQTQINFMSYTFEYFFSRVLYFRILFLRYFSRITQKIFSIRLTWVFKNRSAVSTEYNKTYIISLQPAPIY